MVGTPFRLYPDILAENTFVMFKSKIFFNPSIEYKFHFDIFFRILQSPLFDEIFKILNSSIQWNWHTMSIPYVSASLSNNIEFFFVVKCLPCMTLISSKNEIKLRFTDLLMLAHLSHQASWQFEMLSLLLGFDGVIWADFQPNEKQFSFELMIMMITVLPCQIWKRMEYSRTMKWSNEILCCEL